MTKEKELVSAICKLCLGANVKDLADKNRMQQRLVSILSISAFSRSRNVNLVQKVLGWYFKLNDTSKQGLQLLQRLGITVVPKVITSKQDDVSTNFLAEVYERKADIELWHERRQVIESLVLDHIKQSVSTVNNASLKNSIVRIHIIIID